MKKRLISELSKLLFLITTGFLYYIFTVLTNIYIPCIFRVITKLKCPACGITHMITAVINFDFASAIYHNPFIFFAWPFIIAPFVYAEYNYIKNGIRNPGHLNVLLWIMTVLLLIFGIVRNICGF